MSQAVLTNPIWGPFRDDDDEPLVGGKIYFYIAGTTTLKDTYQDVAGASLNTNPVILNGRGEMPVPFGTGTYKIVVKTAADVVIRSVDNLEVLQLPTPDTFDDLSPMSAAGDLIYGGAAGAGTALAKGTATQVLHSGTTPSWSAVSLTADVSGQLPFANGGAGPRVTSLALFHAEAQTKEVALYSSDTAITQKDGLVLITKGSAAALTLGAPTSGAPGTGDDGKELLIFSTTAFAHTITNASPGFNNAGGSGDVGTMSAAVGNYLRLIAYNGVWYVVGNVNVTIA